MSHGALGFEALGELTKLSSGEVSGVGAVTDSLKLGHNELSRLVNTTNEQQRGRNPFGPVPRILTQRPDESIQGRVFLHVWASILDNRGGQIVGLRVDRSVGVKAPDYVRGSFWHQIPENNRDRRLRTRFVLGKAIDEPVKRLVPDTHFG